VTRRRPDQPPLIRRDADGHERTAPSWETLTERLIREAQEAGHFDDLPGHGRPLQLEDDHLAGEMAMANHVLRNAHAAPPWIEVDKDVRRQLEAIELLLRRARQASPSSRARLERELQRLADAHDSGAEQLQSLAPSARQHRPRLERDRLRARLDDAFDSREDGR
jgi:hypothetical protein